MKYNKSKFLAATAAIMLAMTSVTACSESNSTADTTTSKAEVTNSDIDTSIEASDLEVGYDESAACKVTLADADTVSDGDGAVFEDGVLTISKAGTYILSGKLSDGRIIVNTDKDSEVKIVLNGAEISCSDNSAVYVNQAKKVTFTLESGSENSMTDGTDYTLSDLETNTDAAIFSKSDLTFNGSGKLTISANYKHGIVSKDDLVITDGTYVVTSESTSLEGKDSVKISGGTFDISAGSNGIKATNTEDTSKGFISITGGTFTVVSNNDAFEAETVLTIDDGTFNVTTGGGSANASTKADGSANGDWQDKMGQGGGGMRDNMGTPPDDMMNNAANTEDTLVLENAVNTTSDIPVEVSADTETTDETASTSAKALKAGSEIDINGGTFTIDSADDSFHSNGDINIKGGTIDASSGDDGMHAGSNLTISDGNVTISKSYEGLEGATTTISGGTINVTSSDDGVNCAGGSDTGSTDRMGADQFSSQDGVFLKITGGTITVNADGDGLDSNGDMYIEGGDIIVYGPTNSGNGALDYNGTATISGGTIAAFGATGMEDCFSDTSTQYVILHDFTSTLSANTEFTITDSDGNVILSGTNPKTWQGVVLSSPDLENGGTYTLSAGDYSDSVTISSIITSNGSSNQMGGGMGGGDRRGF